MTTAKIRKLAVFVDEIHTEMGKVIDPPTRRACAAGGPGSPAFEVPEGDPALAQVIG